MGSGSYIGGHTKVFISERGTRWEVADFPARQSGNSRRKAWDDEVVNGSYAARTSVSKEARSFLSMCAVAFRDDSLTDGFPKPHPILQREIRRLGGNKRWIVCDPRRLRLFESVLKKISVNRR
jgi:hypothetical protein